MNGVFNPAHAATLATRGAVCCCLVIWLASAHALRADQWTGLEGRLLRATGWIRSTQGNGTCWIIDKQRRWMITCMHVVGEANEAEIFFPVQEEGRWIPERDYYLQHQKELRDRGQLLQAKVIRRHPETDLAILEAVSLPEVCEPLALSRTQPSPGMRVFSLGNRLESEALWLRSEGHIRQLGRLTGGYFWQGQRLAWHAPVIVSQSPINLGDSGSALVNEAGEVLGVLSAIRWKAPTTAIAIQASMIREIYAKAANQPAEKDNPAALLDMTYKALTRATAWVHPTKTDARFAGWVFDSDRRLLLTTASAVGNSSHVDVIFPLEERGVIVAEMDVYRDHIMLRQREQMIRGIVLAIDRRRDLAIVELDRLPKRAKALAVSPARPAIGQPVRTVLHPLGIEFLWLHTSGSIRQQAGVSIRHFADEKGERVQCLLLQIPHQGGSAGSAVVDSHGKVIGMLTVREAPQQQLGYAVTMEEVVQFLDEHKSRWKSESVRDWNDRAQYLTSRGEWTRAIQALEISLCKDPAQPETLCLLTEVHLQRRSLEAARKSAAQAIALQPSTPLAHLLLAETLARLGKEGEAKQVLDPFFREGMTPGRAYLARSWTQSGKAALADVEEAIRIDGQLRAAIRRRGILRLELGETERGLLDLESILEHHPRDLELLEYVSRIHLGKRDGKKLGSIAEKYIDALPTAPEGYRLLGRSWLLRGDEKQALLAYGKSLRWSKAIQCRIVMDIRDHSRELLTRWPDDPGRTNRWIEDSLKLIAKDSTDQPTSTKIAVILAEKDAGIRLKKLDEWLLHWKQP